MAMSNDASNKTDRPGTWRPKKRHHTLRRRGGGFPSRISEYVTIGRAPSNAPSALLHRTLLDYTAFVKTNPACNHIQLVEIAVVVRDHHDRRARPLQIRQDLVIEF